MKRRKAISLLLGLSLLGLSACGDSTPSENNSVTPSSSETSGTSNSDSVVLTLWHYYNGSTKDALDVMISEFNDSLGEEKNIKVESISYSSVSDLANALVSSAKEEVGMDDMPHIFSAYTDTALLLDNMGKVANMDDYFNEEELSKFRQDFLEEGRFDSEGNLKIIPVAKSTELLFVNETDFQIFAAATGAKMNQMATWEGMAEVAEDYYQWTDEQTPEENDGRALFGVDSEANFMLIAAKQLGEELYLYEDDKVSFGLSEESARKIWENLIIPYLKGHYTSFGSYRSDDVKSGDLLAYSGSTSSVYYFPNTVELGRAEAYDITGTALPYPYFEGGEKVAVQQGAGMMVSLSDDIHQEAAAEFLKWFTSAENNLPFAVNTGYIPVQTEALDLDGVLEVLGDEEMSGILSSSMEITYTEALVEYEFYNNKPFDGSYDTRAVLASSITDVLTTALEEIENSENPNETRENLSNDQSFQVWYDNLKSDINQILGH